MVRRAMFPGQFLLVEIDKFLLAVCSLHKGRSHQKDVEAALTSWPHSSSFWKELSMGGQNKKKKAIKKGSPSHILRINSPPQVGKRNICVLPVCGSGCHCAAS